MENISNKELDDLLVNIYGVKYFIPKKEYYYTTEDLGAIRDYKGSTDAIKQIYGGVNDEAAKELSEDKNATVSWFDETIPEASDITNLMVAEAVCATALYRMQEYQKLI